MLYVHVVRSRWFGGGRFIGTYRRFDAEDRGIMRRYFHSATPEPAPRVQISRG